MLGDIQKAGGIAALKKVDRSQIRDRSGASVGGSGGGSDTGPHGSGLPPAGIAPGGGGGMADALAAALQKRKAKVRDSGESCPFLRLLISYLVSHFGLAMMSVHIHCFREGHIC